MGLTKCCVGGCDATSDTHRVFCFPKIDWLRNLWMSFVAPTNPHLIGLSKDQLIIKRVCQKHFDKTQFDEEGKRLRFAYPCLFTDEEMARGEPLLAPGVVHNVHVEHSYSKEQDDDEDLSGAALVIGTPGEDFHEHPTFSHSEPDRIQMYGRDVATGQPSCSFELKPELVPTNEKKKKTAPESQDVTTDQPSCSFELKPELVPINKKKKKTAPESRGLTKIKPKNIIKQAKRIAVQSLGQTATQRLTNAIQCGQRNERLFENFHSLSQQAQTFLLMQLKQVRRNKMARRFTMEEKLIALALYKQSPKAYNLLQNMFALPNKRTLHRLAEHLEIKPELNPSVFKYIEKSTKNWDEKKKLCTIVFDELALTSHLNYNEKDDMIHGFVDVAGERKLKFCDHALVIMIRGILDTWRQPIAFYFVEGTISAAALQDILKQVVTKIREIGLIGSGGVIMRQNHIFRVFDY